MKPILVIKPGTTTARDRKKLEEGGYVVIETESENIKALQPTPLVGNTISNLLIQSIRAKGADREGAIMASFGRDICKMAEEMTEEQNS